MTSPMLTGARTMAQVVGALLLRETRVRFGSSQIGYLWAILEPAGGVAVFAVVFSLMGRPPIAGPSLLLFFALSMIGYNVFRRITTQVGNAFVANAALLSFPIVKPVDTLIARALLELATGVLTMMIMLSLLKIIEDIPLPARVDVLAAGILSLALLGFGLGVINAVISQYSASWSQIEALIHRPIFMMSGIFFTPNMFPSVVSDFLSWNPILHGMECIRYGYYEGYRPDHIDMGYLIGWGLGTTVIGLAAERFLPKQRVP
ncbi:MAG: ABC transporter permease [Hyphomicrobiaceae bacterium]|nr:ABC transporter permease [Hyphomicrobiaceae bacterium]